MNSQTVALGNCRFEILTEGEELRGIGQIHIGETLVRSGRLPLRPYTQSFQGAEMVAWRFLGVETTAEAVRVKAEAIFRPMPVKLMRDHSFDPVHEMADWDAPQVAGTGRLDLVFTPAADAFNGVEFAGFSYQYEYASDTLPLFYLMDMASWELDGDIVGATAYSQSSCSAPVAHFDADTAWSTEGILHFLVEDNNQNPIMTHNLPRWASHGSFDFQYKGDNTLIGVFDHVDLIRSVLVREAGKPELKAFDKHIFDETLSYATSAKKILLNRAAKTTLDQQNLWTWIYTEVDDRARAEYGIKEELPVFCLYQNYWDNFTVDSYYKDLLPAAIKVGARRLFLDNLKKSAMTARTPYPGVWHWNMCCGHEYEIADELGGVKRVKEFIDRAAAHNVQTMVWTNNDQALSSPINASERDDKGWFVLLEDTRMKYGGAYAGCMSVLDMTVDAARDYFVQSHIKIREQTGLSALYFDSFYNLGFMPVSYRNCKPRTMWRGLLQAFRELQEAGFNMMIESFGPFGQPGHGHPSSYNFANIFACIKVGVGNDYSTIPSSHPVFAGHPNDSTADYYALAHMAGLVSGNLFNKDGQRIDEVWTDEQIRFVAVYHDVLPLMKHRYMQEDGKSVIWHNADRTQATLWNFTARTVSLPGTVVDLITGETLPPAESYTLQERHTYAITGCVLPTVVSEGVAAGAA